MEPWDVVAFVLGVAVTFAACRWALSGLDRSRPLALSDDIEEREPLELSYLRGGAVELCRLIIFDLLRRDYLAIKKETVEVVVGKKKKRTRKRTVQVLRQVEETPPLDELQPIERLVFDFFEAPHQLRAAFGTELTDQLETAFEPRVLPLRQDELLPMPKAKGTARVIRWIGTIGIVALMAYLLITFVDDLSFAFFASMALGIVAVIWLAKICARFSDQLTAKGRDYLERIRAANASLKSRIAEGDYEHDDPALLLYAGIFGLQALADTPYQAYATALQTPAAGKGGRADVEGGGCGGCG